MTKPSQLAVLFALVASCSALADVVLKNAGTTVGPVTSLNCATDAGILCTRSSGSAGNLACNAATALEPGCVTPSDQVMGAGKKTFTDRTRLVCKAHASLTACSSGEKGTWQSCCDHNAPVYCDGTNNRELLGASAPEQVLGVIAVNGIPASVMGGQFSAPTSTTTVTALEGDWQAGSTSDGGTVIIKLVNGGQICSCTQPCGVSTIRTPCSGSCTNMGTLTIVSSSTTCPGTNPYVGGELLIKGTP